MKLGSLFDGLGGFPLAAARYGISPVWASEIEPAPSFGTRIRSDFIEGIGKVNGKFVILLNVNQVLSAEEISSMGQVAATTELAAT